jgi:hypothetical protein
MSRKFVALLERVKELERRVSVLEAEKFQGQDEIPGEVWEVVVKDIECSPGERISDLEEDPF